MYKSLLKYAATAAVSLVLSAGVVFAAVSRPLPDVGVLEQPLLSELSRQFHAETPYMVNFGFDLDILDEEAMARLDIQAQWILAHPQVRFSVFGHTDKVGSLDYNMDLGLRRAQNVVAYLVSKGVQPNRLEALVSFGEDLPLIATLGPERANRRATTFVAGFLDDGEDVVSRDRNGNSPDPDPNVDDPICVEGVDCPGDPGNCTEGVDCPGDPRGNPGNGPKEGHNDAGIGNGSEEGPDPGNSEAHNRGGDEETFNPGKRRASSGSSGKGSSNGKGRK